MTQNRLVSLITYFKGSLEMLSIMMEKEPDKLGKNSEIALNVFKDTLSVLNHMKTLEEELEKVEQHSGDFETVLDEIKNYVNSEKD